MTAITTDPGRTIETERALAALRVELAGAPRLDRRARGALALSALRQLRRERGQAYLLEGAGRATCDYAAYDSRHDVRVLRRYLDLLAAEQRRENMARGHGAVTGATVSPVLAGYRAAVAS